MQPAQGGAPASFSKSAQSCRLSVTAPGRTYLSKDSFPCSLVVDPETKLGGGACYGNPGFKAAAP